MAEEAKGQRFSQRAGWFLDKITGGQWAQQTQQTQQQTSGQQSTGGIFLPWISNNQNLINNNKVSVNNGFTQWIQEWKIKSNIVLPWINDKPKIENSTISPTTVEQQRKANIRAQNNSVDKRSMNEQIEDEMYSSQTIPVLKQWVYKTRDDIKKRTYRLWLDFVENPWKYMTKMYPAWVLDRIFWNNAGSLVSKEKMNEMWNNYEQYSNKLDTAFNKRTERNINSTVANKYAEKWLRNSMKEWDGKNFKYWLTQAFSTSIVPMLPWIVAWLVTKNPAVLAWVGFLPAEAVENQEAYDEAIKLWASRQQASDIWATAWKVNWLLEVLWEIFQLKWILKPLKSNITKQITRTVTKPTRKILTDWLLSLWKWTLGEWATEALQEIVTNSLLQFLDDRDITEWVLDSFLAWLFLWAPWSTLSAWGQMINDAQENERAQKQADIEALNYVMEWEQRKAQRIQAKERLKARFMQNEMNPTMDNGYTPTPEQAQQRAREKEENEQFEDELRAEQNRENSRYQETEWENSWLSEANDYSTDTTISDISSHSDSLSSDSFFKTDNKWAYIEYDWSKLYAWETISQTSDKWLVGKMGKSMFTWNEYFSKNPEFDEYRQNFYKFLEKLKDKLDEETKKSSAIIWKTVTWKDMVLTRKYLKHIIKFHGAFSLNDFLETINNPTYSRMKKQWDISDDWPFYIKRIPNSDNFYYLWFSQNNDWSYNIKTFFEITEAEAEKLLNKKLKKSNRQKYQLKYEEEWYVPWVANKNEKNVSWKEWINLRNKLTKETVKQLAEKYWIKVEVIEWMIEIIENKVKTWEAYGKYLDQLLTLSEQIKESTAPHELLHAIFDMIDPETKTYLISQVMASEWWTAEQSEEWLADSFSNFFRTGKIESAPKSTRWKIKIFFKRVRSFINGMNKWRNELEQIFTDILEANGIEDLQWRIDRNENLQKAKEKMKKRFMEYEKNAEKVKKKENNWKYQTVYHWWPNEFDRFDHLHMWEWEWHQAHGRWHYVAVDPKTARNYAENFSRYKWGTIHIDSLSTDEDLVAYKVLSNLQMWMSLEDSMEDVKSYYRDEKKFYENAYKEDKIDRFKELAERSGRLIKAVDKLNKSDFNTKRNFYEVEIPDPVKANTPTWSNYLEEKGEFTEKQLNNFKKILNKYDLPYTNKWLNEWHIKNWEDLYSSLSEDFISDAWASKFLEKMWYDGIHYFWGRDWEAYVIFNDNALEITNHEKYQKANEKRYRWQEEMGNEWRWIKHNKTAVTENTEWWVFVTPYKDDAVKYGDYILEFEKLKENTVTSKEADKLQERATKQVENDLKNQIDTDYLIEQMALWRLRWFAEYTKKPFVETGNPWWEKWEAVFFEDIAKKYNVKYQRVYHWSPNAFDKFDSTHMWEWEGNQAHGRWHYVAVDPKTARTYAQEKFYKNEIEVKWRTMSRVDEVRDIPYALRSLYRDLFNTFAMWYYDVEEEAQNVIDRAKKEYEQTVEYYEKQIRENVKPPVEWVDMEALQADRKKYLAEFKEALEFIEELTPEDIQVREINDRRNFYEVEIPDPVKADTPTWSNYLEEQAKIKKSEINKFKKAYKEQKWEDLELFSSYRDWHIDWVDVYRSLDQALKSPKNASKFLQSLGYDGIHYDWQRDGECYVIFNDDDLEIKNHEKYQKAEYEYDENGNPKRLKFEEDNNEFDPSIFDWSREDQIESDKESEKNNAFYNAWIRYNNQNYKDDQLTFDEFIQWISKRAEKEQEIYDEKMKSLADSQNDPKLLELQLKAVKLMEKEQRVGKNPNGKNVSKEVRERQQKEVETERENLAKEIFDYMYPWLKFEDQTYDDQKTARDKEAEREMMGRQEIEEKLKLYKKDKNGNREAKDIKIDNPDIKLDKILSSWKFDEIFEPLDRVIEWKTPQGQKGRIDNQKDLKKYKSVMEKINGWKSKTKVTLKDVTQEARALEKYKAEQEAEKERKKKERQEAFAKKKQEEYKKNVRLKAFQKLVDMQRFEKYTFLTEDEIKKRRWFSDEEWKKITEQQDINFPPKKRWENAIRDFNKAVDSEVKFIIEWLDWQNKMKRKEAEKNLWEIWDIDIDVLLWKDEEKWQKEVEEFEKIAKEEKKKSKKEKNKRLEQAREDVTKVDIDTERENNKSEKKKIDKLIKSTKTDKTVRWSVKQFTSDIVTPVSTKIRNISKKIHMEVMRYFQEKDIKTNARLKEIDPFLKAMWKVRKENPVRFMDIWVALANRNIWYANGLLEEYWVKVPTRLLDEIFDEAEDVWLNINYLWSYYPLSVKAPKSFLEELMKVDKWDIASEIEKRITQESQKKWWPLEESEITAIINDVIAWEDKWSDVNTGNKHLKKRNTEIKWTPKMLEYCDDPISTLISYIEWMTQSIERAKFLWKSRSWNVHTLADYVYNAKNGLTPDQQDELMDLLKAVFNDASPNKFVQTRRDLGTLTTLWSPSSTLTQLWDLSFSVYENGWRETMKAVRDIWCKRKAFDLQDMWVVNRWEEYTNINSQKNLLQKAIHNVFKLTFFSTFDTFWKSTYIQSTWKKRQKRAKVWEKWDKQLRKDITKRTDDEYMTDKIINDLKKWVFSQDVALLMYVKLSNIQPLTKAQMPKAYLNNPNWRLFYQFKTFGIKQLDYVLQETKENTKNFKSLSTTEKMMKIAQIANMVFIMTLLWVWADELKDLTMRRRSNSLILRWLFGEEVWAEQIWEKMEDNVLKLFWLSRYTVMQMKSDPVDAITSLFTTLPATNLVNYPFKDIYKAIKDDGSINWRNPASYQLIPIVWKYRYWIYGWWQDKQQQALGKWKNNKKKNGWWGLRNKV